MDNNFLELLLAQKALPANIECVGSVNIDKISKSICAFLNEQGGWIIVGIDNNHECVDVDVPKAATEIQYELTNNIAHCPWCISKKNHTKGRMLF